MNIKLGESSNPKFTLTRDSLAKLKQKARRRGIWYRDLKQNERMLLDLTISVVQRIKSFMLAKLVVPIITRLCEAMESRVYLLARSEGAQIAEHLSQIAQRWGNRAAKSWVKDRAFIQFLVVVNLNLFGGCR